MKHIKIISAFCLIFVAGVILGKFAFSNVLIPVPSMYDGSVSSIASDMVEVQHKNIMPYFYKGLDKIIVKNGQIVQEDDVLGYVKDIKKLTIIASNGHVSQTMYKDGHSVEACKDCDEI